MFNFLQRNSLQEKWSLVNKNLIFLDSLSSLIWNWSQFFPNPPRSWLSFATLVSWNQTKKWQKIQTFFFFTFRKLPTSLGKFLRQSTYLILEGSKATSPWLFFLQSYCSLHFELRPPVREAFIPECWSYREKHQNDPLSLPVLTKFCTPLTLSDKTDIEFSIFDNEPLWQKYRALQIKIRYS